MNTTNSELDEYDYDAMNAANDAADAFSGRANINRASVRRLGSVMTGSLKSGLVLITLWLSPFSSLRKTPSLHRWLGRRSRSIFIDELDF